MAEHPAGPHEALAFAERQAAICRRELGGVLSSVILHGSLAFDDYRPGGSDVDLLGVVERPLGDEEGERLVGALAADRAPARLDLRVVTRAVAANPTEMPSLELYASLDPGREPWVERRFPLEQVHVELSVCRAHGRTLVGSAPTSVIGEVPHSWILRYGGELLETWQSPTDDAPPAELMVFTACRIWRFGAEGVHCSKTEAADWALMHDPTCGAVRDALRRRNVDRTQLVDPTETSRLLAIVRARLGLE